MKPILCRVRAYSVPGLPRPAMSSAVSGTPCRALLLLGRLGGRSAGRGRSTGRGRGSAFRGCSFRSGCRGRCCGRCRRRTLLFDHARWRDDRGDREIALADRGLHARGKLEGGDVQRVVNVEGRQTAPDEGGGVFWGAEELDFVTDDVEHAAALDAWRAFLA